jgi:outer membrane protein TolC
VLVLLFLLPLDEASAKIFSLDDFLQAVDEANPTVQASKLRAIEQKHRIDPSASLDDPFIAAGVDQIPFSGGTAQLRRYQISQTIPFPGKLSARKEIAEKRAQAAESDSETLKRKIRVIAIQSYLRASYNLLAIQLNERIQKIIQETSASAKARYKTGSATHHEWLLGKLELSMLNIENLRLKRLQTTLYALLNELRNVPPDSPIETKLDDATLLEPLPVEVKLEDQPELMAWKFQEKSAVTELKLAKLSYAPDFVIQGMAMEPTRKTGSMGSQSSWGVMVGITVPLFFWRKQKELVAAAENERMAVAADFQALQNRLNTEVSEARQLLRTSLDVISLYKKDVIPLTELAVKNARSAYATKTLSLSPLLDVLRSQQTQELELIAAKMDAFVAKTRLKELLSTPPVTRFAPARPTLFGGGMGASMNGGSMQGSSTINMGSGMSGPTRKQSTSNSSGSSMDNMGGM